MDPITMALIASVIVSIIGTTVSAVNANKQMETQKELQEDAQDFNHTERVEQNEYQQQMHEFNLVNDPKLQMQGFHSIGMSDAAAIQAIAGSPSTGFSPTASNVGSGIGTAPSLQGPAQMLSGLSDAFNSYFENQLKEKQGQKTDAETIYTKQLYEESLKNIEFRGKELDLSAEQVQIAKDLAASQIGLQQSEVDLNYGKLEKINADVLEIGAKIENLNAETAKAYAEASLYRQKTLESAAQTEYLGAQTEYVNAQTQYVQTSTQLVGEQITGQQIANLDADVVLQMKEYRLQVSKALHCDVDAPLTTQVLEAMIAGDFNTVYNLVEVQGATESGMTGVLNKTKYLHRNFPRGNLFSGYKDDVYHGFSPSFQSTWTPVLRH